jgi:hypothetical protein
MDCTQFWRGWKITVRLQGPAWVAYGGTRFSRESAQFIYEPIGLSVQGMDEAMQMAKETIDNRYERDAEAVLNWMEWMRRSVGMKVSELRMGSLFPPQTGQEN